MEDLVNFYTSPLRDQYELSQFQWCYLWLMLKRVMTNRGATLPPQTWFEVAVDEASSLPHNPTPDIYVMEVDRLTLIEAVQLYIFTQSRR